MKKYKKYSIDQCALYKLGSKKRLAQILNVSQKELFKLAKNKNNYRIFELPEKICPFTKKITKARLVQEPKQNTKKIHSRLQKLVSRIETPQYAHAAIKERSYRTNAQTHEKSQYVATLDIRKFYPSTKSSLVRNFFANQLLCAPDVANILTNICCAPNYIDLNGPLGLPTGSPLSPILSLHANKPMFDKLYEYGKANRLIFTCYVDDLTFSGEVLPKDLIRKIEEIVYSYGHTIASEKTKIFTENSVKHITGVAIKNYQLKVPFSRFQKARLIERKIKSTPSCKKLELLKLHQKLSGLLGEAAFLDNNYESWAQKSYAALKVVQREIIK